MKKHVARVLIICCSATTILASPIRRNQQITEQSSPAYEIYKKELCNWSIHNRASAEDYIKFIEEELNTPITLISTGPDRKSTIFKN